MHVADLASAEFQLVYYHSPRHLFENLISRVQQQTEVACSITSVGDGSTSNPEGGRIRGT